MSLTTSCHCGKMSATFDAPVEEAMRCNCSICRRKGYLLVFMPRSAMQITTPESDRTTYTFKSENINHQFCNTCGCSPFGSGIGPGGNEMAAVNLNCVDGLDTASLKVTQFDGAAL